MCPSLIQPLCSCISLSSASFPEQNHPQLKLKVFESGMFHFKLTIVVYRGQLSKKCILPVYKRAVTQTQTNPMF